MIKASYNSTQSVGFLFYELFTTGKCVEAENRLLVALWVQVGVGGNVWWIVSFGDDENVLKLESSDVLKPSELCTLKILWIMI